LIRLELVGRQFGRLTVVSFARMTRNRSLWNCRCSCGKDKVVRGKELLNGSIKSCGCLKWKHDHCHKAKESPTHVSWRNMKERCTNPKHPGFKYYGARGISVCSQWADRESGFAAFLSDVGRRPNRLYTIHRIENDKNYEVGNCRWATKRQQVVNRRRPIRARSRNLNA
jgi:hypothetical protein